MLKCVLEQNFYNTLCQIGLERIQEIRIRAASPATAVSGGQVYFISPSGLTLSPHNAFVFSKDQIESIIYKASEFSIYSIAEELKNGFIVLKGGVRIGVCGSVISENSCIKTITAFTSLNIRIPHTVKGACAPAFTHMFSGPKVLNTLVISPPGQGKTTFLRDFVTSLATKNCFLNTLVVDERGEIAGSQGAMPLGGQCDIISFSNKLQGFLTGIRAMNPDVIITDEIGPKEDFDAIAFAAHSGVSLVATIHAWNLEDLSEKPHFDKIRHIFKRFVVLASSGRAGQISGVYTENFENLLEAKS